MAFSEVAQAKWPKLPRTAQHLSLALSLLVLWQPLQVASGARGAHGPGEDGMSGLWAWLGPCCDDPMRHWSSTVNSSSVKSVGQHSEGLGGATQGFILLHITPGQGTSRWPVFLGTPCLYSGLGTLPCLRDTGTGCWQWKQLGASVQENSLGPAGTWEGA